MFAEPVYTHCCQRVLKVTKFLQEPNLTLYNAVDAKQRTAGTNKSGAKKSNGQKIWQKNKEHNYAGTRTAQSV